MLGALFFMIFDSVLRKIFTEKQIEFPSMMAGLVILFALLVGMETLSTGLGDKVFQLLLPGTNLLSKWLPVFFIPGLIMAPLAPKLGSALEAGKVLFILVGGFFYTIVTTVYAAIAVRSLQGKLIDAQPPVAATTSSAVAPPKPYSEETVKNLFTGSIIFGVLSYIAATQQSNTFLDAYKVPIHTLFMACTTVGSFVYGARLPKSFTTYVHPLVTGTVSTLIVTQLFSKITGQTFESVLQTFKVGTLNWRETGAGDILLYLLGPSVVCMAIPMYEKKTLMKENIAALFVAVMVTAVGGLFGTAAMARLLRIQSDITRLSVIPRMVTTALAMEITKILGGNLAISATCVVLTGIFGATVGKQVLAALKVTDPVCRGLAIGGASQGLGVAGMVNEKDAFPFAAIGMVLTAVAATTISSIPAVKKALIDLALGTN
eukprot:CAMPEP_0178963474 /NCGR_PEP_ID=MMETSP0789-20121207/15049_1 /TAXON_ID=3005 /ORGANISM="Rhizosolenia setigera, Strain CCMP 1694" /LENGTH=431 /DNA_ID=CAMNT_0020647957 /DNA_START=344 /DNA_END=1639 /DNA_ORIENTATION=-